MILVRVVISRFAFIDGVFFLEQMSVAGRTGEAGVLLEFMAA